MCGLKHTLDQFFGGCFSVAARHANYGAGPVSSMPPRQRLQCMQCVRNQNVPFVSFGYACVFVDYDCAASGLKCLRRVEVPIEVLTFQGKEELTVRGCPGIRTHTSGLLKSQLDALELRIVFFEEHAVKFLREVQEQKKPCVVQGFLKFN